MNKYGLPSSSQPAPWLLYRHGKNYTGKTFHPFYHRSLQPHHHHSRGCSLPLLRRKSVVSSFPGWLLLEEAQTYSLWNPSTLHSIDLPSLSVSLDRTRHLLVTHGTLSLLLFDNTLPCIYLYRCGRWKEINYGEAIKTYYRLHNERKKVYPLELSSPVCCNGKLYALTHNELKLVEIEIDDEVVIRSLGCDMPKSCSRSFAGYSALVEFQGTLLWISMEFTYAYREERGKEPIVIYVYELDFDTCTWVRLDSLGDRAVFLCFVTTQWTGFTVACGGGGGRAGCVYFPVDREKYVYCYDVEDNSLSVLHPTNNTKIPTPWLPPIWVMPDRQEKTTLVDQEATLSVVAAQAPEAKEAKETNGCAHDVPLSLDVLEIVSKKLSPLDYMSFRRTCMLFCSVAPPRRWRGEPVGVPEERPLLVIPSNKTHRQHDTWRLVDPYVMGGKFLIVAPTHLPRDVTVRCSKAGWLLLSCGKEQTAYVFFNPFTKAIIWLPDLDPWEGTLVGYAFSTPPTHDDCTTVSISWRHDTAHIFVYTTGMADWDCMEFENASTFMPNYNSPVFWNGAFYFLGQEGNLGVLTVHGKGNYEWKVLDRPKKPCHASHQNQLVECGGDLLAIFIGYMGKQVEVFRLKSCGKLWERVVDLGGHAVFLSLLTSTSTSVKSTGSGNRIYFPMFYEENMIYYSLETRKYHPVTGDEALSDYADTKEPMLCGWIEPTW